MRLPTNRNARDGTGWPWLTLAVLVTLVLFITDARGAASVAAARKAGDAGNRLLGIPGALSVSGDALFTIGETSIPLALAFAKAINDDAGSEGQWIPTTSLDQLGATLARWFGVPASGLGAVFPNIGAFSSADLGFLA